MTQEIWKNVSFIPKDVQKFYHHIKFCKSIANSEVFYKKTCSWKFHKKTPELESLFNKMQAYRPANLLKRPSSIGIFLTVIAKFLRTAILKNICERMFLRVFPFMLVWRFPYINNIINYLGKEEVDAATGGVL